MGTYLFKYILRKFFGNDEKQLLVKFLEKADNAYIKAFQYKMLGDFSDYAFPEVYSDIQHKIIYRNNQIWGTEDFRKRKWDIIFDKGNEITVRKEITFKTIKFGQTYVPMSDNCIEYWTVIRIGKDYKIKEIQSNG